MGQEIPSLHDPYLHAPNPPKKGLGNSIQKIQTGMQLVMHPFRNITTLNIIDIVDQLSSATESGRVCMGHV